MGVRVVTDSVSYLPSETCDELGIDVVSLQIVDGGVSRREVEVDYDDFYRRLADTTVLPTSAQPSPEEMVAALRRGAEAGDEVLGIFMTAKMSGTVESARMAASMVAEEVPGARIEILDAESNSMQEGFAVEAAARVAADGGSMEDCLAAARDTIARTRFVFTPNSLEYLRRGGRIGNASALLGTMLQICPVLTVEDSVTTSVAKVRTHSKALRYIADWFARDVEEHGFRRAIVHSIAMHEDAKLFAEGRIEPIAKASVPVIPIGPVIGTHVGPAVAVVYETEEPLR